MVDFNDLETGSPGSVSGGRGYIFSLSRDLQQGDVQVKEGREQ